MTFQNMNQRGVSSSSQFSKDISFRPKRNVGVWKPKHTNGQHSQGTSGVTASLSSTSSSNAASTLYGPTENKIVTNASPCESSLFSSLLSDIFTQKLRLLEKDVPSSSKSTIVGSLSEEKPCKSLEEMDVDTLANLLPDEDELFSDLFDGFGYNSHAINNGESEDLDVFSSGGGMELEGNENLTSLNRTTGVDRDYCLFGGSEGKLPNPYVSSTLFVRNIDGNVRDYELRALFEQCGKIRYIHTGCKYRGFVMVSYYDIETAQHAKRALQNTQLRARKLDIHYSYPKGKNARETFSPTFYPHSLPQYHGSSAKAKGNFSSTSGTCDGRHIQGMSSTGNVAEFNGRGFPDYGVYQMWNNSNMHQQPSTFPMRNLSSSSAGKSSTKPLQLAQIHHGRPPMTSMSKIDSNNERTRSHHHQKSEANTNCVDKEQYELDLTSILCGVDRRTTLMLKNIPNKYTSRMLIEAIDAQCRGTYDFLYLPIDFKYKCNVGYAFVNMIDPIQIIPFHQAFNGKKWEKFHSNKRASLSYARIQGRDSLIAHFQNSIVMKEDKGRRPILFHAHGANVGDMELFPISNEVRLRNKKPYLPRSGNMENQGQGSSST